MKKLSLGIASTFMLVTIAAFAANFTDDTVQIGKPGSSADKSVIFGASNKKKLSHKPSTLTLDYEGNNLSVGDGANTADKTIKLNKGVNSPTFRHNFTSGDLEIENAPVLNQKGNTVSVGDGTNTNKVLKFNKGASSPEIRYNSSTGKLQFTNDTTTYKDIGSGSGGGGGTNLLQEFNSDFEAALLNWTASGGTFVAETTDPLFGLQSGSWDSSASAQTLSSQLVTIEKGFIGKKCTADIEYKWASGVAGDLSFQVVDQVPNILATVALEPTTGSNTRKAFLAFDCPSVATDQLRVRLLSNVSNPALIVVDNAFVGVNKSTTNVSQASVWARARWAPATSCQWDAAGGGTVLTHWTDFPADTDCNNPTVFGQAVVPLSKVPRLRVANLPPGKYRLEAKGWHGNAGSNSIVWTTTDGTNDGGDRVFSISASGTYQGPILGFFEYTSAQSNVEFRVISQLTSGSGSGIIPNAENTQNETLYELVLYRYPTESAEALNLETSGGLFRATHATDCAFTNSSTPTTAAAEFSSDATCTFATSTVSGNFSGVTSYQISSNNAAGVTFNSSRAGAALVTVTASITQPATTNGYDMHLVGGVGLADITRFNAQSFGSSYDNQHTLTGIVQLQAGSNTIKLVGGVQAGTLSIDGTVPLVWSVVMLDQQFPAPVFTEVKNKMNAGTSGVSTYSARVTTCGSAGTIANQQGATWLTAITNNSAGSCDLTVAPGIFSNIDNVQCTFGIYGGGPNAARLDNTSTTTSLKVRIWQTSTLTGQADNFNIICTAK